MNQSDPGKKNTPGKKLLRYNIQDLTLDNLKTDPKIRLYLGIVVIAATCIVLVLDAQFDILATKNTAEKVGQFIGCGIMIALGIWLIVKRNKKQKKRYNDKIVDDLD
jgi:putative Mn2+ efflux pump MntP